MNKNTVTAGLPAVDALQRFLRDKRDYQQLKADQAVQDAERGKQSLFAKDGERDPSNEEQQKGQVLHSDKVIQKLKKLNYKLHFERSINFPDRIGIYVQHPKGEYKNGLMFLMGFRYGAVPQYSIRKPDPTGKQMLIEERGWMKLLIDLAKWGVINLAKAEQVFEIDSSAISHNYAVLSGRRRAV
jgi:hypothetical protein